MMRIGANGNSIHGHAPQSISLSGGGTDTLTYDANGNMTIGVGGKTMCYDGENRPLAVNKNGSLNCTGGLGGAPLHQSGTTTFYSYAPDGTRLKRTQKIGSGNQTTTAYINGTEFRDFGTGAANEELITHLTDEVRLRFKFNETDRTDYLHRDQLGTVIGLSNASGATAERRTYHPFGKISWEFTYDITLSDEDKGFIGERYDEDSGLQYLNARYYDPELALFIQPDWFPVTGAGVGTNRYSYSFNDPVNKMDPNGNFVIPFLSAAIGLELGALGTALTIAGYVQTGLALANGADPGEVIKSATISMAASLAGGMVNAGLLSGMSVDVFGGVPSAAQRDPVASGSKSADQSREIRKWKPTNPEKFAQHPDLQAALDNPELHSVYEAMRADTFERGGRIERARYGTINKATGELRAPKHPNPDAEFASVKIPRPNVPYDRSQYYQFSLHTHHTLPWWINPPTTCCDLMQPEPGIVVHVDNGRITGFCGPVCLANGY